MKFSILILLLISAVLLFLSATSYQLPTVSAQTVTCLTQSPNPRVSGGLITTRSFSDLNSFGSDTGQCVADPKAAFAPYKIPTYDDLKSIYYTQAKSSSTVNKVDAFGDSPTFGQFNSAIQNSSLDSIFLVNGNLTISNSNFPSNGTKTAIIFVDGNTDITTNITYGGPNFGLILIVQGNINISQAVTRIDAVIISSGTICTAYDGTSCPATNATTSQLVINGSLISLTESAPIKFRRALADNNQPAEIINHQPKYLVILRNLFADTWQSWSEIQ